MAASPAQTFVRSPRVARAVAAGHRGAEADGRCGSSRSLDLRSGWAVDSQWLDRFGDLGADAVLRMKSREEQRTRRVLLSVCEWGMDESGWVHRLLTRSLFARRWPCLASGYSTSGRPLFASLLLHIIIIETKSVPAPGLTPPSVASIEMTTRHLAPRRACGTDERNRRRAVSAARQGDRSCNPRRLGAEQAQPSLIHAQLH